MKVLEIENLSKKYRAKTALDGASLSVDEGFVMGLVGPNGAGKTTLIKCVLNLVRTDSGTIRVFGESHLDERRMRARIGFVHEASYLFEQLTAAETERVVRSAYPEWDHESFVTYLNRFEIPRRSKIKTYSKGMKMRLSLAIALSHKAELILMDEPSSGLDPIVRRELLEVIGEELAREQRSFLISTHITSDLDRIADHIVILDRGKVRLTVSRDELGDNYALCRGGRELLTADTNGYFIGVQRNEFGFTALTRERSAVVKKFGDQIVTERPTVEDLMVHTLREEK